MPKQCRSEARRGEYAESHAQSCYESPQAEGLWHVRTGPFAAFAPDGNDSGALRSLRYRRGSQGVRLLARAVALKTHSLKGCATFGRDRSLLSLQMVMSLELCVRSVTVAARRRFVCLRAPLL